jgi:hypothetical protein
MSGRAGRRGIDAVGVVLILCWNEAPEPTSLSKMITGKALKLTSQFRYIKPLYLSLSNHPSCLAAPGPLGAQHHASSCLGHGESGFQETNGCQTIYNT